MSDRGLAVHRTIVALDVEGFGARQRTNRNQVAVRDGLYRTVWEAFQQAGIPQADHDHEDRGDGVFILVGSEVPKSLFVEALPSALATELRRHNGAHPDAERIRLRMALHAGEVNYDAHGATGASINLTFRLLESEMVKGALAGSSGVLAVIVSSWFFEEVVRHSTADTAAYYPVLVAVKETTATGWICLPDQVGSLGNVAPERLHAFEQTPLLRQTQGKPTEDTNRVPRKAPWRAYLQIMDRRQRHLTQSPAGRASSRASGLPVAVPFGMLPVEVRGRQALIAELLGGLARRRPGLNNTWVLVGMGGLGKSTVALSIAQTARSRGWRVWWVNASDSASITGGILEVLHQARAPDFTIDQVRAGAATAAENAWEFLNSSHSAGKRWLLVFDNADTPSALAAQGVSSPADYTGWLRPDPSGMVIVTSRIKDSRIWGMRVKVRELNFLEDATGARVLSDLAPNVVDPSGGEGKDLSRRLGGLPLALHLAGSYLASPFAGWQTFAEYRNALDTEGLPSVLADIDQAGLQVRGTIQRTWDLSLNALADDGRSQARPLLHVLSCYAPATPIPFSLLDPDSLARFLSPTRPTASDVGGSNLELEKRLRDGLRGLATVGLIDVADRDRGAGAHAITVHPVVADTNRSRLLGEALDDLPAIAEAAIGSLGHACSKLDCRNPTDWPRWRSLVPHASALLTWLAIHLDADILTVLIGVCERASDALRRCGGPSTAESLARSSLAASVRLGEGHPATLIARHRLLQVMGEQGRNKEAEEQYRELLGDQQRVLGDMHPDTLITRHDLAWMIEYQGRYSEAEQICRELLADQRQVLGDDHSDTMVTQNILARLIALQGRYHEAEQLCRTVLQARQHTLGENHPDTLTTRHNLAWITGLQGRYAEAEKLCREVLAARQRSLGIDHPASLTSRRRLARTLGDEGRYREAAQILGELIPDLERVQGADHPATLMTRNSLARVTGLAGQPQKAEQQLRKVLAGWERIHGGQRPGVLEAQQNLARMIALQGRFEEAERLLRQVLAERKQSLGDDHPDIQSARFRLAEVIVNENKYDEAESLLRIALKNRQLVLGDDHPDTIATRQELEKVLSFRREQDMPKGVQNSRFADPKGNLG